MKIRLPGPDPAGGRQLGRAAVHRDGVPRRLLDQLPPLPAGLPAVRARAVRGGDAVTIVAALRLEALAVGGTRIGMRARRPLPDGQLVLAGVAGAVAPGLGPGDIVVADRVVLDGAADGDAAVVLPGAADLAKALRIAGLTVHLGPVGGADRIVTGAARAALGRPRRARRRHGVGRARAHRPPGGRGPGDRRHPRTPAGVARHTAARLPRAARPAARGSRTVRLGRWPGRRRRPRAAGRARR